MIFTNATIITMNAYREIIHNGAIAIRDNRIIAVDRASVIQERFADDDMIDVKGKVIIPGLIDTHVHLAQALIRGCADDMSLIQWLCDRVWVLQGSFTHEDAYVSARLCIAEMLRSGTTTFLEAMLAHRYGFDGIAQAVEESGIRACLGGIVMDTASYASERLVMHPGMIESRETSLFGVLAAHDKWHGKANDRIHVWFGARTPGGVSAELYREMSDYARQRNMHITMHLGEVEADRTFVSNEYHLSLIDFAESVGLLGPQSVLVHMVWLTQEEIAKIGGPSNNDYDMIREMKLAAILHKAVTLDPLIMPAETVLEMATINGARALGLEREIGSLEVGKKADLVVVNFDHLHLTPSPNPVSTLVYAATGGDVDTVVVDGRVVVEHGKLLTMNEDQVIAQARKHAPEVYRRAGIDARPRWPVIE